VKDRCNAITLPVFRALGPPTNIALIVEGQLSNYNYIFPFVSVTLQFQPKLTQFQANNAQGTPRRKLPYRNDRIFEVIYDLYFTGGIVSMPFSRRFQGWFPVHEGNDGVVRREVPIPMLALVATAVRTCFYC
jgi:hypothetical protein